MAKYYSKISGSTGASIGTIIAVFKSDSGSFDINDYPGYLECNGDIVNVNAYPALYAVIGTHYGGATTISTLTPFSNRQNHTDTAGGQFRLPDFRGRKLVGINGVDGAGSPSLTPSFNPQGAAGGSADIPGCTGGSWIMNETRQGAEYFVGNVSTTGYTLVSEIINTGLSGETSIKIGPIVDAPLKAAPEHTHILLTSTADPNAIGETATRGSPANVSQQGTSYAALLHTGVTAGFIYPFGPPDGSKTHAHKLCEYNISASRTFDATYDSSARGDNGSGDSYYVGSSGSTAVSSISSSTVRDDYTYTVSAAASGMSVSTADFTLTAATPLTVVATIVPNGDIPLLTRYFRVKYLIKAF